MSRICSLTRPMTAITLVVGLVVLVLVHRLPGFPSEALSVESVAVCLALPALHKVLIECSLLWSLLSIAVGWWLPRGQSSGLAVLAAVASMAVPLVLTDPLITALGLLLAAGGLALVVAQGEEDGGVPLLMGAATLGVLCLVIGLAASQPSIHPTHVTPVAWWPWAVVLGFALLLGLLPGPFWLAGAVEKGHPLGAVLAVTAFPSVVFAVALAIGRGAMLAPQAQAMVVCGLASLLAASVFAFFQTDVRRMAGFLLVADLGCTVVVLGADLQTMQSQTAFAGVFLQLLTRGLAASVVVLCLAFLSLGLRQGLRLPLAVLLGLGLFLLAGGPLTPAHGWRWETLREIGRGSRLHAMALGLGGLFSGLAALVLLARAARLPVADGGRPLPRLALMVVAAPLVVSLIVWRHADWAVAHLLSLLGVP